MRHGRDGHGGERRGGEVGFVYLSSRLMIPGEAEARYMDGWEVWTFTLWRVGVRETCSRSS